MDFLNALRSILKLLKSPLLLDQTTLPCTRNNPRQNKLFYFHPHLNYYELKIQLLLKLFGGTKTKSNHGELLRTIGFSSAPGLIRVFGITPELMTVTFIGSAFWMLAWMVVAVKAALDYDSLWKAFGVVVVSWLFQAFFLFLVLVLFKGI